MRYLDKRHRWAAEIVPDDEDHYTAVCATCGRREPGQIRPDADMRRMAVRSIFRPSPLVATLTGRRDP